MHARCFVAGYAAAAAFPNPHARGLIARGQCGRFLDSIDLAAAALGEGRLVAFPTETVYGLGAHAFDAAAVARIFAVKGRPKSDPLIVHVPSAAVAEPLVMLDDAGRELMHQLMADFWPGPLTLVAPACPTLPPIVTAGTGFVGVRCPAHRRAVELLQAAGVPVAAPSANRFGHVSPTRPEHVMDDLGDHPILVLRPEPGDPPCDVGIESTVLKLDSANRELLLLRRGGVPEAELKRWHADQADTDYGFRVLPQPFGAPLPLTLPPEATVVDAPSEQPLMVAPGMLLTHYAPDLPCFVLDDPLVADAAAASELQPPLLSLTVDEAVVLDFGARLAHLKTAALAYRDLSPRGNASEAARAIFAALRWAEGHVADGARCVLLPNVEMADGTGSACDTGTGTGAGEEHAPALADRLFRAASGRSAWVAGAAVIVAKCASGSHSNR